MIRKDWINQQRTKGHTDQALMDALCDGAYLATTDMSEEDVEDTYNYLQYRSTKDTQKPYRIMGAASEHTTGHVLGYASTERAAKAMVTRRSKEFTVVWYNTLQANGEYAH